MNRSIRDCLPDHELVGLDQLIAGSKPRYVHSFRERSDVDAY